jgi:hypothetical protein
VLSVFLFLLFYFVLRFSSLLILKEQYEMMSEWFRLSNDCTALTER